MAQERGKKVDENNHRTTKDRASDIAENPYLKVLARVAMVFATFIAAPVIYWVIGNIMSVNTNLATIVLIQQTQQQQVQKIIETQGAIINTQATEAQTRAVSDAQFDQQIKDVKEGITRASEELTRQNTRVDDLSRHVYDTGSHKP